VASARTPPPWLLWKYRNIVRTPAQAYARDHPDRIDVLRDLLAVL
jgi:hypothetical protein